MRKTSLFIALSAATLSHTFLSPTRAADPPHEAPAPMPSNTQVPPGTDASSEFDAAARAELESLTAPLPAAKRIYTHTYRAGHITTRVDTPDAANAGSHSGLPQEKLIYSNTGGTKILKFGVANRRMGDDLGTNAAENCGLSRYAVRVNGGVLNGLGEFSCKTALWDRCPGTNSGANLIPGSEAEFIGLEDDLTLYHDLIVGMSPSQVSAPTTLWVTIQCDSATAGWVFGTGPEFGYSHELFFHPSVGCQSLLGPASSVSFYAQVFAFSDLDSPCSLHFRAFVSESPTLPSIAPGADQRCADDFISGYDGTEEPCILSAYEVGIRGANGPFNMQLDLRVPYSNVPIPGTEFVYQGVGANFLEVARHIVPEDIDIPIQGTMWVTWEADQFSTGLVNARFPAFGNSGDRFYRLFTDDGSPFWSDLLANPRAAVYLVIYCRGDEPDGACCYHGGSCLDDLPKTSCSSGRWLLGDSCNDDSFDPPCGTHACCLPGDVCADISKLECEGSAGIWHLGVFCETLANQCRHYSCLVSSESCLLSHQTPGCSYINCCQVVCDADPYCCLVSWDDDCIRAADGQCDCVSTPGDYCSPPSGSSTASAKWVTSNTSFFINTCGAFWLNSDPAYCCMDIPQQFTGGSVFFRFIATDTSARINTCETIPGDAGDSLLQVYRVGDPTTDTTACNSLISIACSDSVAGCGDGTMSDLCVTGLVPGETYYFTLASKTAADKGIYHLSLESPCPTVQLTGPCSDGIVEWLAPVSGILVDARQPIDPDDPTVPQGVTSFLVAAPPSADDPVCWTLCDTLGNPLDNEVLTMAENGDGTLTLYLQFPITPGAATTVAYAGGSACVPMDGDFQSLPGDIDGDRNVLASTDGANFAGLCLTGLPGTIMERCDIDRSGHLTAADLIRLFDLMNGAGPFDPWLGQSVSMAPCE